MAHFTTSRLLLNWHAFQEHPLSIQLHIIMNIICFYYYSYCELQLCIIMFCRERYGCCYPFCRFWVFSLLLSIVRLFLFLLILSYRVCCWERFTAVSSVVPLNYVSKFFLLGLIFTIITLLLIDDRHCSPKEKEKKTFFERSICSILFSESVALGLE